MQWLEGMITKYQPELIAFESPFIPMGPAKDKDVFGKATFVTTAQTLRLQITLAAVIETTATKHGIACREVTTQSAKKELVGFGRAPAGDKKWDWGREMVIAATNRGWKVADDHQADAAAVAHVAMLDAGLEVE